MGKYKKGRVTNYLSGFLRAALVALLLIFQFAVLGILSYALSNYSIYVNYGFQIIGLLVIVGLINDSRSSSFKIVWICIILLIPVSGLLMYWLWAKPDSKKKIEKDILGSIRKGFSFVKSDPEALENVAKDYPDRLRMVKYMESQNFKLSQGNKVDYYPMGEDVFEAMFQDIEDAKDFILMNFFIVGEGALWDRMHEVLRRKCEQGVEIFFLYDDFGSMFRTPKDFKRSLEAEGIKVRIFNPVHRYFERLYMNYRSHQKIFVVDGGIGYTGGINLADEYVNLVDRFGVWKDNAVRIEGEGAWGLTVVFLQMWNASGETGIEDYLRYRPKEKATPGNVYCHLLSDGPANNPTNPIQATYRQLVNSSKGYLYITTPYLTLEEDMRQALIEAKQCGVDVRLITPLIPDKKTVSYVTRYNYGDLLKAGIRIFEYTPGFIHAKTIITEDCGIVGTINVDFRSFYLHYECGAFMIDKDTICTIKRDLEETMSQSREISYGEWLDRPWSTKLIQRFLNLMATLM